MEIPYDMVVFGDICLDWCCRETLSLAFSDLLNGKDEWLPILELPGGSGLLFAAFAQQVGYKPFLVGKIGDDAAGTYIYKWLQDRELDSGISFAATRPTGKVFMIIDRNGKRLLVSNRESANDGLSVAEVRRNVDVIAASRLLYVSGHCFKEVGAQRIEATRFAMEVARKSRTCIAFDLVPHRFHEIYPELSQFQELTEGVDILISEVSTIRRIFKMGDQHEMVTKSMVEQTIAEIANYFTKLILRYGPHGTDYQAIWDAASNNILWQETDYAKAEDRRGYGDQLTVRVFKDVWKL